MKELLVRFVIGGILVSCFAMLGDVFRPKSFAGLFGAAPSVALATLGLTIAANGKVYAAIEARSMIAGAAAFLIYSSIASWILMRFRPPAVVVTLALLPLWLTSAFGIWLICLRHAA